MYYYYYYFNDLTKEVELNLKFHDSINNENAVDLSEFNKFIEAINELHKRIIYLTQPEYKFPSNFKDFGKIELLNYHELQLKSINRENPFILKLITKLISSYGNLYLAVWKILIAICKKYGKTLHDLISNSESFGVR